MRETALDRFQLICVWHVGPAQVGDCSPAFTGIFETEVKADIGHVFGADITSVIEKEEPLQSCSNRFQHGFDRS